MAWNLGVNNLMAYVTGDIPVGSTDPDRLSNIGIGHAAIDVGGGYTYLNTQTGREFSVVSSLRWSPKTVGRPKATDQLATNSLP